MGLFILKYGYRVSIESKEKKKEAIRSQYIKIIFSHFLFIKLLKSSFSHKLPKFVKSLRLINTDEKNIVLIIKNNKNIRIITDIKPMLPKVSFKNI